MARVQTMFAPSRSPSHRRVRRGAFTMIEILIVIGVLAVLSTIVLLGMRHITGQSKEQQTRVSMQNLRNMLAEYNARTRMKAPREWYAWDQSQSIQFVKTDTSPFNSPDPNVNPACDFWRVPYRAPLQPPPPNGNGVALPIAAPGSVEKGQTDRAGRAVQNTALASLVLVGIPENRTALQSFNDKLMQPETDDTATLADEREARIPLDAWSNPILLVPGSGLSNVTVGGQVMTQANPIRAQDNQPFWASAGPDGDFQKGDDNIYSFEE